MNHVFADSSFWIALRDRRETLHASAQRIVKRLFQERATLVVTPFIFAETHAYFVRHRPLRERVLTDFWDNPVVHIEHPSPQDQRAALSILRRHDDKAFSFCDAISFVVMQRLGIPRAVSFDDHFRQIGNFEVIG